MNVPIEIIIVFLTAVLTAFGTIIAFFYRSIETLKNGFSEVKDILIENRLTNDAKHNELEYRICTAEKVVKNHDYRISRLESK